MGTFNRHVLKELVVSLGFWFLVFTALAMSIVLTQLYRNLASQGLAFVLAQAPMMLAYVCPHTLAIAASCAATTVMGRLSADREIEAMRTSGIPQSRVLDPVFLVACLVASASTVFALEWTPAAYRHKKQLEREAVLAVLKRPPPGEQTLRLGRQYLMRYRGVTGGNVLESPFIVERDADGTARAYYIADTARADTSDPKRPMLVLERCARGTVRPASEKRVERIEDTDFTRLVLSLEALVGEEPGGGKDLDGMTLWELWDFAHVTTNARRADDALSRFHGRIAASIAPLMLVLLSAGVGLGVRRASLLAGFGWMVPSLMVYYLAVLMQDTVAPPVGPYLGLAVMTVAALGLVYARCRR